MSNASRRNAPQLAPPAEDLDCTIPFVLPPEAEARARLRLSVMGRSPLLTHNAQAMLTPAAARGGKNIPEPEVEAEAGVYRTAEGHFAILGLAFRLALLEAATIFKAPKGSRGSIAPWLAHIEVREEFLALLNPADLAPLSSYEIDRRPAVVQRQRILRARPRFNVWAIGHMTLLFDEQLVPNPTILPDIMADAGQRKGVGDYRPGKSKGWFGRFALIGVAYGDGPWQAYTPGGEIARLDEVDPAGVLDWDGAPPDEQS